MILLVGDLHLTSLPRDAYRWEVFQQLRELIAEHRPQHIVLLGDLTDEKDRHPAELVNRIANAIDGLVDARTCVHIVRGNHDGIDDAWPYFLFLSKFPRTYFYPMPEPMHKVVGEAFLMLPHSRNPLEAWKGIDFSKYKMAFAHVTVDQAVSESGATLRSSISAAYFRDRDVRVYSGDVHVPQRIGALLYVGAPYAIRFGDSFKPRVILLDGNKERSIDLRSIQRLMLDIRDAEELATVKCGVGDQAKVRLHLPSDRLGTWLKQRKEITERCRARGLQLVAVELVREKSEAEATMSVQRSQTRSPQRVLESYVAEKGISKERAIVGKALLEKAL